MTEIDLRELFLSFQQQLLSRRETQRQIPHAASRGAATESAWQELLSSLLPNRYGVTRAFVIDHEGRPSDQIDLVIHDPQYTPLLFEQDGNVYVTAESVYGVFEVKQRLNAESLRYAADKAASVRRLKRTSARIYHHQGVSDPRDPKPILGGVLAFESEWSPPFGDAFHEVLADCKGDRSLEIGCALQNGAFYVDRTEEPSPRVEISEPDTALAFFCLALLQHLQRLGTVTAIDYAKWRKILER